MDKQSRIVAVLGPTNTGKTHYAIERMLAYRTGIIGLPLRLLAREVYDRIVALRGPSVVALVTGEERIVPPRAQYWVCTVEAMPKGLGADFVAIDEIQLCADPDRGHVFTERLLNARGQHETLFLGAETMAAAISELVPKAHFLRRERFSELTHTGSKKISRMAPRSAIVGFSVDNVYAIAELLRRQKGGAAVVMGALSPRTRNAQVELYQNGDVDYLVATDAIGMGLNLDIDHVAFSSLSKFDGRRMRNLQAAELAQIAGRAGRHVNDGTFGTTGEAGALDDDTAAAITNHRFSAVRKLHWRNAELNYGSVDGLISSLEAPTSDNWLTRVRESDDLAALKALAGVGAVRDVCTSVPGVQLLWDVCRIPDFRSVSPGEHAGLLEIIFGFLQDLRRIPDDWLAQQIKRIDRVDGDIDTLSKRLSYIRTWTYVAQRNGWVDDENHWREQTRAVEDRLSDALHGALTQRFVDRRTSILLRRLKQKEVLVALVNDNGDVTVEEQFVGRLEGFRFIQDASASPDEAKTLRNASVQALKPEFHLRSDRFYNAPDTEIDYTEQGGLMWGQHAVGKLVSGNDPLHPTAEAFVDEEAGPEVVQKVQRRLQHFIDRKIATLFEPLLALSRDEELTGLARGFAFRLVEGFGIIKRDQIAAEVKELDQDARGALRKHGIRFGQYTIFMQALLKPAPTRLRILLWSLASKHAEFPESPPPGLVTIPTAKDAPVGYHTMSGYRPGGARALRIDMLERLADLLRAQNSRAGFEANPDMLSITGMTLEQFADLMQGLGYKGEKGERAKVKAAAPLAESVVPEVTAELAAEIAPEIVAKAAPEAVVEVETEVVGEVVAVAEVAEAGAGDINEAVADVAIEAAAEPELVTEAETGVVSEVETEIAAEVKVEVVSEVTAPVQVDADIAAPEETGSDTRASDAAPETPAPETQAPDAPAPDVADEVPEGEVPAEVEAFYTFTWGGFRPARRDGEAKPRTQGRYQGKKNAAADGTSPVNGDDKGTTQPGDKARDKSRGKPQGKPRGNPQGKQPGKYAGKPHAKRADDHNKPRSFSAAPARTEKKIDPDNPFAAALMGLRDKK